METLEYLKRAATLSREKPEYFRARASINLITNITDAVMGKLLIGLCIADGLYPDVYQVPYQQYAVELKNPTSGLAQHPADITFVYFDVNPYITSALRQSIEHAEETLNDIESWSSHGRTVVLTTIPLPYRNAYANLFGQDPLFGQIELLNARMAKMVVDSPNIHLCDINRLLHRFGEDHARDWLHVYASDIPFTTDFSLVLCKEWLAYLKTQRGEIKKCIVVDLDNTIWGGVVGEVGPLGIALGPGYPGTAFVEFQRALLSFHERGVLLAINSRNNMEDVQEVFEKNPFMLLKPSHFAAMAVNWKDKAENLVTIAKELNIGLDSLVFLDDDEMNRGLVRKTLPEVSVPDFSLAPEQYVPTLFDLDGFHQLRLTDEDRARSQMAGEERERREVQSVSQSVEEYIAKLEIKLEIKRNATELLPRLAQLTQKTNQFNLTTLRLSEGEITQRMETDGLVFSCDVVDRFGPYGTTVLAIFTKESATVAKLEIFLMSCRVMGRGVEKMFLQEIFKTFKTEGITTIRASYLPTPKNPPCKDFLPQMGFTFAGVEEHGRMDYEIDISNI